MITAIDNVISLPITMISMTFFVVGMMMMYFAPLLCTKDIKSTTVTMTSRFGRLLLPLSFCALLMGCDAESSASSVGNGAVKARATSDATIETLTSQQEAETSQQSNGSAENINLDAEDDGQSLIAIAKTDDTIRSRRAPMFSAKKEGDSALEATLIGDYTGMLPCTFCDGIALTLNLFSDGSVLKTSVYENPESPRMPLVESGVYRQDDNTIIIVDDAQNIEMYRIQDNHLVMLDENKTPDADYTLSRK